MRAQGALGSIHFRGLSPLLSQWSSPILELATKVSSRIPRWWMESYDVDYLLFGHFWHPCMKLLLVSKTHTQYENCCPHFSRWQWPIVGANIAREGKQDPTSNISTIKSWWVLFELSSFLLNLPLEYRDNPSNLPYTLLWGLQSCTWVMCLEYF